MTENEAPTFGVRFGFFLVLSIYIGALTSLLAAILSIMLFGLPEDALSGAVLMVLVVVGISMVPVFIVSVILGLFDGILVAAGIAPKVLLGLAMAPSVGSKCRRLAIHNCRHRGGARAVLFEFIGPASCRYWSLYLPTATP